MIENISILILCLLVSGCGAKSSSKSSSETEASGETQSILAGRLLGFNGFLWDTETRSGTTDQNGRFSYREGEVITFYVGSIKIGETQAQPEVTLDDLVNGDFPTKANVLRLLATLDIDQNSTNGVQVTPDIHDAAKGKMIIFGQSKLAFDIDARELIEADLASDFNTAALLYIVDIAIPKTIESENEKANAVPFVYPLAIDKYNANDVALYEESLSVVSLMQANKMAGGRSQLEFIFDAFFTEIKFEAEGDQGSIYDLYVEYKKRIDLIGVKADTIDREDIVEKPEGFSPTKKATHIAVMTDFQVRDEESPLHVQPIKYFLPTAFYAASPHITFQVNDMVKTLRGYEAETDNTVDMAIFGGDLLDIGQYNEARWGIDVLDGGVINPDSGINDDPIPGTFNNGLPNDTFDTFQAVGLNAQHADQDDIPWYYVEGNHDGLAWGTIPLTTKPLRLFGKTLNGGTYEFFNNLSTGGLNFLGYEPSLLGMLEHILTSDQLHVPDDENRRMMQSSDVANEMFITTGTPVGHGMQFVEDLDSKVQYAFTTNDRLIRHIVMDTNTPTPLGFLEIGQLKWIEKELKIAKENGQLVIVSSHHNKDAILITGLILGNLLAKYENVIAHLVAHTHINKITPRVGRSSANSYWEIETASMVNWPQQFRMLDVAIDPDKGVGVIKTTMLNHETSDPRNISNRGRFLSYIEAVFEGSGLLSQASLPIGLVHKEGLSEDRNTHLYFKVADGVLERIRSSESL